MAGGTLAVWGDLEDRPQRLRLARLDRPQWQRLRLTLYHTYRPQRRTPQHGALVQETHDRVNCVPEHVSAYQ